MGIFGFVCFCFCCFFPTWIQVSLYSGHRQTLTSRRCSCLCLPRAGIVRAPPRGALVAVLMVGHSGVISYPILQRRPLGSEWVRELERTRLLRDTVQTQAHVSKVPQDGTGPRRMLTDDPHLHTVLGTSPAAVQHFFGYHACSVIKSCAPPQHSPPPPSPTASGAFCLQNATLPVKKLPAAIENPAE